MKTHSKRTYFYHYLVVLDPIVVELSSVKIQDKEKKQLLAIVESHIYYRVLDLALSQLSKEEKEKFLQHLDTKNHLAAWDMLKKKNQRIEEIVQTLINTIIQDLLDDIKKTKT